MNRYRLEHRGIAEGLAGPDRGCDVEGDQRARRGDSRRLQDETVLGFVVAEANRLGIVQSGDTPAAQGAEGVTGAGVSDTAVEDDVEIEPAAWGMGRREIEHEVAIEDRGDLDATIAGRGEDRFLFGAQVGDEHAESGGAGRGEPSVAIGSGSGHSDTRTSRRTRMARAY